MTAEMILVLALGLVLAAMPILIVVSDIVDNYKAKQQEKLGFWKWETVIVTYQGKQIGTTKMKVWHDYKTEYEELIKEAQRA